MYNFLQTIAKITTFIPFVDFMIASIAKKLLVDFDCHLLRAVEASCFYPGISPIFITQMRNK